MELLNILVKEIDTAVSYAVDAAGTRFDISGCEKVAVEVECTVPAAKTFVPANVDATANTITITGHGFETALGVTTSQTGTLPAPLVDATVYYVIKVSSSVIKLATSAVNALAGTAIDFSTVGVTGPFGLTPVTADIDIILQQSIDGDTWFDLDTEAVTAAKNLLFDVSAPAGRYMRVYVDVTAGQTTVTSSVLGKGLV